MTKNNASLLAFVACFTATTFMIVVVIMQSFSSTMVTIQNVRADVGIGVQGHVSSTLAPSNTTLSPSKQLNINNTSKVTNNNTIINNLNASSLNNKNNTFVIFQDNASGISIQYPTTWEKIQYPEGATAHGIQYKVIANFLSPLSTPANVSSQWRPYLLIEKLNPGQNQNLSPQTQTVLGGNRAYKSIYTSNERIYTNLQATKFMTITLKTMQIWTTDDFGNTYLLTYAAAASQFNKFLPTIQSMIDSFKLTTAKNNTLD
jgi:hypothetical protein